MKIVSLNPELEPLFWKHVHTDIPHYYFFITDVTHEKENSKVALALDEKNRVEGMMLIYREYNVLLRGSAQTVNSLLTKLDVEKAEINAPAEIGQLVIPDKYKVKQNFKITLMTLKRGEETPKIHHELTRLSTADADEIATLMQTCDPDWWAEVEAKQIAERMRERFWLGIRKDEMLVSIGGARLEDFGSNIHTVATHRDYRNRGYATSIVSALVKEILKKSNLALIHVDTTNEPAKRAYTKAGFRPYKNYTVTRTEKKH